MFRLEGKTAVITGAGSGIGEAIATIFAKAGAFVYLLDRDRAAVSTATTALQQKDRQAEHLVCDVSDESSCNAAAEEIISQRGTIDILVNNAGIGHVGTLLQTTGEDLDRLFAVNVRGVFNLTKAFLPEMLKRQSGSIINMASIGGVVGISDRLAYCTTKFAVVGFTKSMALDHAKDGIRVNCICPGRVETPFVQARLKEYPDPEKAYREMSETQAVGRMGQPDEIAAAALYLASDEAEFITGSALVIDGGFSAGK